LRVTECSARLAVRPNDDELAGAKLPEVAKGASIGS